MYEPPAVRPAVAVVHLDGMLKEFVRVRTVDSPAPSVRQVLVDIEGRYPRLMGKLRDETGKLRRFIRVFVNGADVSGLAGLDTPVGAADRIDILHSIAGG
jgi:molybdopterin synthase sulfur carrier subunit